jgi:hypothetical protein
LKNIFDTSRSFYSHIVATLSLNSEKTAPFSVFVVQNVFAAIVVKTEE